MTTKWTPDPNGRKAAGIEFHSWLGFERGSDLWHRYRVLGFVTLYRRREPLVHFLKRMAASAAQMRGNPSDAGR